MAWRNPTLWRSCRSRVEDRGTLDSVKERFVGFRVKIDESNVCNNVYTCSIVAYDSYDIPPKWP